MIVAIKQMSAGNETVGEMWNETKVFDENTPVGEVMSWATENLEGPSRKNVILTRSHNAEKANTEDS